jgi:hypothetical protein
MSVQCYPNFALTSNRILYWSSQNGFLDKDLFHNKKCRSHYDLQLLFCNISTTVNISGNITSVVLQRSADFDLLSGTCPLNSVMFFYLPRISWIPRICSSRLMLSSQLLFILLIFVGPTTLQKFICCWCTFLHNAGKNNFASAVWVALLQWIYICNKWTSRPVRWNIEPLHFCYLNCAVCKMRKFISRLLKQIKFWSR